MRLPQRNCIIKDVNGKVFFAKNNLPKYYSYVLITACFTIVETQYNPSEIHANDAAHLPHRVILMDFRWIIFRLNKGKTSSNYQRIRSITPDNLYLQVIWYLHFS